MVKSGPRPKKIAEFNAKGIDKLIPEPPKLVGQRILIIVESPKKIAKIKSYLPNDNLYKILPSVGHVVELSKSMAFNLGLDILNDYKPKFIISTDKVDILRSIIIAAKEADKILIATDPDREGEFIGYSIIERLKGIDKPIKRIEIHEITKKGVLQALKNEREIDMGLVQAAISRRVLDRVVGFLVSPLVIRRLGNGLSAGRVQSVALRIIVDRELEIESFEPEEYWNINVNLTKFASDINFVAKYSGDKIKNKKDATKIKEELEKCNFVVSKVEAKETKKQPPLPITTSRLQMLASSRYGFGGQRTMKAAQRLYENGDITYIRTDSVRQSDEAISDIRDWIKTNKVSYLPDFPNIYKNKGVSQDAHESIRPTHIDNLPNLKSAADEDKLYRLIWEITVASQMTPALYDSTVVNIKTDKKHELKATGSVLKSLGWLSVTKYSELEKEDEKDIKLPLMVVGDTLSIVPPKIETIQKFTQPPKRYSEGSLIKELEKKGIGRPSTYADITNKITERKYVSKVGNSLVATEIGKKLVLFLKEYFSFMEYNYTSDLEIKLDKMTNGELDYISMMNDFYPSFKKNVDNVYLKTEDDKSKYFCDKCGSLLVLKRSSGIFLACSNYPFCKNTVPCEIVDGNVVLSLDKCEPAPENQVCPKCGGKMVIRVGKFGKFYACIDTEFCRGWKKIPAGKNCPKCGNELNRSYFGWEPYNGPVLSCSGYPRCRHVEKIDDEELEKAMIEYKNHKYKFIKPLDIRNKIEEEEDDF